MDIKVNNSNVDFQARLYVADSSIYGKYRNWTKIESKFGKLTKKYADDVFVIRKTEDQLNFKIPKKSDLIISCNSLGEHEDCSHIRNSLFDSLMELSDDNFTKALATLFGIQKHSDDFAKNAQSFINNNQKFLDNESDLENFYFVCESAIDKYVEKATVGKTPMLLYNNRKDINIHVEYNA